MSSDDEEMGRAFLYLMNHFEKKDQIVIRIDVILGRDRPRVPEMTVVGVPIYVKTERP